ncbi:MAG: alpha/beta hydrolase fold domain-containing protein [Microthrixaceae bacterium]
MKQSRPAFDPELRRLARVLPRGVASSRTLHLVRPLEWLAAHRPPPPDVAVEAAGSVTVRVHRPPAGGNGPMPAILWVHGGGYVFGLAAQDDPLCRGLAQQLGAVVAAVEYRKAPEHPFPAALDDCHEALVWLASSPEVDPARVAVAGASAGGGLAAALAIEARSRGEVRPVFQSLLYPMLDDRTTLRPDIDERGFRLWNNESNRFGWRSYLGTEPGFPGITSPASPARETDLSGLPDAWIGVGTLDLFLQEDLEYAERLRDAGVGCEVEVAEGAFHAFDGLVPGAAVSRRFRASQVAALARAFGTNTDPSNQTGDGVTARHV